MWNRYYQSCDMAETAVKLSGDLGRGIHSVHCGCSHDGCDSSKEDKWCCHWFLLYLVPSRLMMPSEVLEFLRDRLGTRDFKYFTNPKSKGTLRVLVYVEDLTLLGSERFGLVPREDDPNFVHEQCRAWRLPCCAYALRADWTYWHRWLSERGGPQNCGNVIEGVGSLVDYLRNQVTEKLSLYGRS